MDKKLEDIGLKDGASITNENLVVHLKYLIQKVDGIDKKLEEKYITKIEFDPIKRMVYGVVALILVAFFTGLVKGVF